MKHLISLLTITLPLILMSQDVMITRVEVGNEYNTGTYRHENPFVTNSDVLYVNFDYMVLDGESYRVRIDPFTNGEVTSGNGLEFSNNQAISGQGTTSIAFRINHSGTEVEEIRFMIRRISDLELVSEFFIPCDFRKGSVELEPLLFSVDPEFGIMRMGLDSVFVDVLVDSYDSDEKVFIAHLEYSDFNGFDYSNSIVQSPFVEDGIHRVGISLSDGLSYTATKLIIACWSVDQSTLLGSFEIPVTWNWGMARVYNIVEDSTIQSSSIKKFLFDYELRPEVSLMKVKSVGLHAGFKVNAVPGDHSSNSNDSGSGYTVVDLPTLFQSREGYNTTGIRVKVETFSSPGVPAVEQDFPFEYYHADAWVNELKFSIPTNARIDTNQKVGVKFVYRNESGPCSAGINVDYEPYSVGALDKSPSQVIDNNMDYDHDHWFSLSELDIGISKLSFTMFDGGQSSLIQFRYPLDYRIESDYYSVCGADAPLLSAPVGLTKSFAPVNGVRDRVQLKWYKGLPKEKYTLKDAVKCDIEVWPVWDLVNDIPIEGASIIFNDKTKNGKYFFKWPVKFRSESTNNNKRVLPNTRYNWKVRCGCIHGEGLDSEWSVVKLFNTPDFDPVTGIYEPGGIVEPESSELKGNLENPIILYPNPADTEINIDYSSTRADLKSWHLIDMAGKMVKENSLSITKSHVLSIDLSDLSDGLYILQLNIAGQVENRLVEIR